MSKTSRLGYGDTDATTTSELFEQLSISLDNNNKFLPHKHIASKPKLKRLLKLKPCSSVSNISAAVCTRCKKETLVFSSSNNNAGGGGGESNPQQNVSEKEVEVKKVFIVKSSSYEKKVQFGGSQQQWDNFGETTEKADDERKVEVSSSNGNFVLQEKRSGNINSDDAEVSSTPESEPAPATTAASAVQFQSVFFARRASIIGNNEFWLPTLPSPGVVSEEQASLQSVTENLEGTAQGSEQRDQEESEGMGVHSDGNVSQQRYDDQSGESNSLLAELSVFLNNIFKHASAKQVRILQVATMLDDTLAILTEEHFFKCKSIAKSYEIMDAICLKDVQRIMVSETCTVLVLQVCHASSSLTEFKEFVPGYSEKTESLISLMVYALSRIKNLLLDVARFPLLALPTCETMHNWFAMQNEDIMYTGIATAENISHPDYDDLSDESFMMKIAGTNQFHPVLLLLRSGYLTSKCNGGCASKGCKYSITLELKKEKVSVLRREDNPWPNCVRLITHCMDITFAGSRKASADDLMEKLYSSIQPVANPCSMKFKIFVVVTESSMKLFKMTKDKSPVFGSPLLNLEIFDEEPGGTSCIIDSQGVEVADIENLQIQNRWHLAFLNQDEKLRFLAATTVE